MPSLRSLSGGASILGDWQDAFGHEIRDHFHEKVGCEIMEWEDGHFDISPGSDRHLVYPAILPPFMIAHIPASSRHGLGRILDPD